MNILNAIAFVVALVAVTVAAVIFFQIVKTGRKQKKSGSATEFENHLRAVKRFDYALPIVILTVEAFVLSSGGRHSPERFLYFHLLLDVMFLLSWVFARFIYTGLSNPERHRFFVLRAQIFFILAALTGAHLASFNPLFH